MQSLTELNAWPMAICSTFHLIGCGVALGPNHAEYKHPTAVSVVNILLE